jgi:hypothetical protein
MIPYVIEQSNPSDDIRVPNIDTHYYSSEKDKLNENIINNIIQIMYEFCSDKYGYGIKITSYHDFCDKYWKIKEIGLENFYIFYVKYFENDWKKDWIVEEHKEEIYNSYINKCGS